MRFDVVLPLYRPAPGWDDHIAEAVGKLRLRCAEKGGELHVSITNDGFPLTAYPEAALKKIEDAAAGNFSFLPYEENRGKGYSIRYLCARIPGEYLVYTDGDFPFGWEAVAEAFDILASGEADVVMGRRSRNYAGALTPLRKILSRGVKFLNRILLRLPRQYMDTQSGLKGFNAAGKEVFLETTVDTFVFDTEFILMAWRKKLRIAVLDIEIRPGLILSSMGLKVMFREFFCFCRVLWRIRIAGRCRKGDRGR